MYVRIQQDFIIKEQINSIQLIGLFTNNYKISYIDYVVAKSTTVPENTHKHLMANNSTPLKRAFFVCSLHTPKEKVNSLIPSMVTCSGKVRPCYIPLDIVFQTATRYRQILKNKAVTFTISTLTNGAFLK